MNPATLPPALRGPGKNIARSFGPSHIFRRLIRNTEAYRNFRHANAFPWMDGPLAREMKAPAYVHTPTASTATATAAASASPPVASSAIASDNADYSDYERPIVLHGAKLPHDPFAYMENPHHPDYIKYVRLEQKNWSRMSSKMNLQSSKHSIWKEQDQNTLFTTREGGYDAGEERIGNYVYVTREVGSAGEVAFFRKRFGQVDLLGEELINPDKIKQQFGYAHCNLGVCRVSPDGKYLAFTISIDNSDRYICHLKSIENASVYHVIQGTNIISVEFGSENRFFYTDVNETNRPYCVKMVEVQPGLMPSAVEVFREDDEEYFVDIRKTKDGKYLVISADSKSQGRSNALVAPASYPIIPKYLKPFFPRPTFVEIASKKHWCFVEHHDDCFILITNDQGDNHRVIYTRDEFALKHGLGAEWKELIPCRKGIAISDNDIFRDTLVLFEQTDDFERQHQIRTIDLSKGIDAAAIEGARENDAVLHLPPLALINPGLNRNMDQNAISFSYSTVCSPVKDCTFNFRNQLPEAKGKLVSPHTLFQTRQHETFTPHDYMWNYSIYRDLATSQDGTQVPITIVQMRDAFVEESSDFQGLSNLPKPCLLFVYGSYGEVPPMHFQLAPHMYLLRRRFTIAFAHVRGGGEFSGWAEQGRHKNKNKAVEDFIACCEFMTERGYTTPDQMTVAGASAGAVPIAAAMNRRGDTLFKLALLKSPFLDVLNTMLDPSLPLTLAERGEWGDPLNNAEDFETIKAYCPYTNINDRVTYPSIILSTSLDDDRVPAWNAVKYAAKIRRQRDRRTASGGDVDPFASPILLRVQGDGGHGLWHQPVHWNEELAFMSNLFDVEAGLRKPMDVDTSRLTENQAATGIIDEDDAQKSYLRWENWEQERLDYHSKLQRLEFEPNYRQLKAAKAPYFWIPTDEEVEQKVNENMSQSGRETRFRQKVDEFYADKRTEDADRRSDSQRDTGI